MPAWRKQTAESFAAEREAFDFDEFFAEMMVVEAGVAWCGPERRMRCAHALGQAAGAGASAAGVRQSRCAALPVARFETFDMPRR